MARRMFNKQAYKHDVMACFKRSWVIILGEHQAYIRPPSAVPSAVSVPEDFDYEMEWSNTLVHIRLLEVMPTGFDGRIAGVPGPENLQTQLEAARAKKRKTTSTSASSADVPVAPPVAPAVPVSTLYVDTDDEFDLLPDDVLASQFQNMIKYPGQNWCHVLRVCISCSCGDLACLSWSVTLPCCT
eukprot:4259909-Amphidinium_carterae.1